MAAGWADTYTPSLRNVDGADRDALGIIESHRETRVGEVEAAHVRAAGPEGDKEGVLMIE